MNAIKQNDKGAAVLRWQQFLRGLGYLIVAGWGGSYVARFIRGSRTKLSNHSWGTAFDINTLQNGLGKRPALGGEPGSVRALVTLANKHGFNWGGHFSGRLDGMHVEAGKGVQTGLGTTRVSRTRGRRTIRPRALFSDHLSRHPAPPAAWTVGANQLHSVSSGGLEHRAVGQTCARM